MPSKVYALPSCFPIFSTLVFIGILVTSWSQGSYNINSTKRQENEKKKLTTSVSFYQEKNNFARNFQQTSIYMSLARPILHGSPTKHQLQGSMGKGVFNWAYCHLKQNQDYVSKEGNKQCLPKTKGKPWLL